MTQSHSIVLWKNAESEDKPFDEIAAETFALLSELKKYPKNFQPNFLPGNTRKDVRPFDWDIEHFRLLLEKGMNKEGGTVFRDLGYGIQFFSSLEEEESCGIMVFAGATNPDFINSLTLELPFGLSLFNAENAKLVRNMFESLAHAYRPFFGCVSNRTLTRRYGALLRKGRPAVIHWLNYWSTEIVGNVGLTKIQRLTEEYQNVRYSGNILSIKDIALNCESEEDMELQKTIQEKLLR